MGTISGFQLGTQVAKGHNDSGPDGSVPWTTSWIASFTMPETGRDDRWVEFTLPNGDGNDLPVELHCIVESSPNPLDDTQNVSQITFPTYMTAILIAAGGSALAFVEISYETTVICDPSNGHHTSDTPLPTAGGTLLPALTDTTFELDGKTYTLSLNDNSVEGQHDHAHKVTAKACAKLVGPGVSKRSPNDVTEFAKVSNEFLSIAIPKPQGTSRGQV